MAEQMRLVIAVSGDPGSGKSTVCERLAAELGLRRIYAGGITRELASELGMSLLDYEQYAHAHPENDRDIEARQIAAAKEGNVLLEGRMAAWCVREAAVPAFSLFITIAEPERIARTMARDKCNEEEARQLTNYRQTQLVERLRAIYGVDFTDPSLYDAVIDVSGMDRETQYQTVLHAVRMYLAGIENT